MQSQRHWEGISTNPFRPMQHMLRSKLQGISPEAQAVSADTDRVKPTPKDFGRWEILSESTRLGRCRNDSGTIRGSFSQSKRSFARYAVAECLSAGEILSDFEEINTIDLWIIRVYLIINLSPGMGSTINSPHHRHIQTHTIRERDFRGFVRQCSWEVRLGFGELGRV